MTYVSWNGLHPHKLIALTGFLGIIASFLLVRWMYHTYDEVNALIDQFLGFEVFILVISLISLIGAVMWWFVGRWLVPLLVPLIGKLFFRGQVIYIDKNQIKHKTTYGSFLSRYISLALATFFLNFLLTSTIFNTPENSVSPISYVVTIVLLTFLIPTQWILQDIGMRTLNEEKLEISSMADFFGGLVSDYVITSSVFISFINILVSTDASNIPIYLQVSLIRSVFPCFIMAYVFTILLSSKPENEVWKQIGIKSGETLTTFDD